MENYSSKAQKAFFCFVLLLPLIAFAHEQYALTIGEQNDSRVVTETPGSTLIISHKQADEVNVAFFLEWPMPSQVAKVEKTYDAVMGTPVNWVNFDADAQMIEAMLAGDVDISYGLGVIPFIKAVNNNIPIKMIGIAVQYPANDCIIRSDLGINADNTSALAGQSVAVPSATLADYSFQMMMHHLNVDTDKLKILDQAPVDAAVSLANGEVALACGYGDKVMTKMRAAGNSLMNAAQKKAAGIFNFGIIAVTETFSRGNPELVQGFMKVTNTANEAFAMSQDKIEVIARDAGMSVENTTQIMRNFTFPSNKDQLTNYLSNDGLATEAVNVIGRALAARNSAAAKDYSLAIDSAFLK